MALREPVRCTVDVPTGRLLGGSSRYEKRFADLAGLYADAAAFAALVAARGAEVAYAVEDLRPPEAVAGDMIFGVTRMVPGQVGGEFFMTRGHIHARADRPEVYYGEAGRGVMLMESPDGEVRTVAVGPRTLCYVPPFWIHRSVNVGAEPLVMSFAYPADAGQDYDIIARAGGMRQRIVAGGDGWRAVDNPSWRPREPGEVAAILAGGA